MKCRFSGKEIPVIHSFGMQPLANGFLQSESPKDEYFFEMSVAVNLENGLFQLVNQPNPAQMFHENYAFFSRTSNFMKSHFEGVALELREMLQKDGIDSDDSFVIEIGSNDGVMLEHMVNSGIRSLGIEPSLNVAQESNKYGIETISEFLGAGLAQEVLQSKGPANIVYAANVFCHIPDINDLAESCSILLKDNGYLVFEDPYLGDVLQKVSYDQIYDEHVYLFNCTAVQDVFKTYGLELFDCKHLDTHGGSMRYYFKKSSSVQITSNLSEQIDIEDTMGIKNIETYKKFSENCEFSKSEFKKILESYKAENLKIVGYGATSKSTTILNYCNVGNDLIDFFVDTTPIKQNTYTPGKHIPVLPYSEFVPHPEVAVLFAWNHKNEIMNKEKDYTGKWITHLYEEFSR
ncbi:class I SAM-dependent methyltransferase [Gammaproteobacteria bacterium]|nr:class I SAM-dependent methyltransferase [Gammaproteobacteria bacterium]